MNFTEIGHRLLEDQLAALNQKTIMPTRRRHVLGVPSPDFTPLALAPLKEEPIDVEGLRQGLIDIELEQNRRGWSRDPVGWIEGRLGNKLWSMQREIARAVAEHKRVAIPSCYASGKSFLAARLTAWWIDSHKPGDAFVVTTATTGSQVKAVLWREIGRAHAAGKLAGRLNQTEWWLPISDDGREELVAFGRKPQDLDSTAFQGIHARYVLVILDEAAGIPKDLFEAADSLVANRGSRILAIGNPEDPDGEFFEACKPGSGWQVLRIPASATPNFTHEEVAPELLELLVSEEWVEEKRRKWGVGSPMWKSKIEAEFPEISTNGLIPIAWVRAAQERSLEAKGINELGIDVGGGGDKSTACHRRGPVFRIVMRNQHPDTMETCGAVIALLHDTGATCAKVDEIGIGKGIVDRGREQKHKFLGINVGKLPRDTAQFLNFRAEAWWHVRDLFESGNIDISKDDDDLVAQLIDLRYKRNSSGQIVIESKAEMLRRGRPSPDEADSLMLAAVSPEDIPGRARLREVEWG